MTSRPARRVWRGYSMGPDSDMLIDPAKTTALGKPVGADSSLRPGKATSGRSAAARRGAGIPTIPQLNLIYYGSGNPSTWNPKQRPGDNKWSMTIWARDVDTGAVRWVYQMTPHDEWDYDGVNEMILADQQIGGQTRKTLVHFDRNGLGYTLDRATGELLVAEKFDPKVNWTSGVDMNKNSPTYGRPAVVAAVLDRAQWRGRELQGRLPGGARLRRTSSRRLTRPKPACSTCRPTTSAWTTSRSR